jgi:photosystem II stability/assembly factor-like uncharacterized protein
MGGTSLRGRRERANRRRTALRAAGFATAASTALFWLAPSQAVKAAEPSAIGNEAPLWISVAPDYARSHMVAALTAVMGPCQRDCSHLWVTRDGGATWRRHARPADSAQLAILADDAGRESVVTQTHDAVERSDDDGDTWHAVGPSGTPTTSPFDHSGVDVAVPDGFDYVAGGRGRTMATGSGGTKLDLAFAASGIPGAHHASTLLATVERRSNATLVLHCDVHLSCTHAVPLPKAAYQSGDVSLLLGANFDDAGFAIARTTTSLFTSIDGGNNFVPVILPARATATYTTVSGVALGLPHAANGGGVIYMALLQVVGSGTAASTAGGVYASRDGGASWTAIDNGGPVSGGATSVAVAPDGRLFAGYVSGHGAGLVCSEDASAWHTSCTASGATGCATTCPQDPAHAGSKGDAAARPTGARGGATRSSAGDPSTEPPVDSRADALPASPLRRATSPLVPVPIALAVAAAAVVALLSRLRRRRR